MYLFSWEIRFSTLFFFMGVTFYRHTSLVFVLYSRQSSGKMSRYDEKRSGQGGWEKNCKTQSKDYHNLPIHKPFRNISNADGRCGVNLQVPMTEFISSIKLFVSFVEISKLKSDSKGAPPLGTVDRADARDINDVNLDNVFRRLGLRRVNK